MKVIANLILAIICSILIFFILTCGACTSTKHVKSSSFDSTWVKSVLDSNRVLRSENSLLQQDINAMKYIGVYFDTLYLPGDTVVNTVEVTKEGDVKATGRIKSASFSEKYYQKLVWKLQSRLDSLSKSRSEEKTRIVYKDREVQKKVKVFTQFYWWILMFALGYGVAKRKSFFSFLRG